MVFYGVEAIEEAVDRSKEVLLPFDFLTWTRLAVIIIFLGGMGASGFFFNMPFTTFSGFEDSGTDFQTGPEFQNQLNPGPDLGLTMPALGVSVVIVGAVIGLILVFLYLNSLAEFVMFRSLDDKEVRIRRNIRNHYIDAAKYFLFKLAYGLLFIGLLLGWFASFAVNPIVGLLLTLIAIPLFVAMAVFAGIVHDFTLLEIINSEKGFIDSLKHTVGGVRDEWRELGVYLILRLVISYAVSLMSFAVIGAVSLVFLLVFGIIAGIFALLSPVIALAPAAIGLILWFIALLYIAVPFRVYIYSYFIEVYNKFFR